MLSSPLSRNLHCEYNAIIMSPENNAYVQVRGGKARMDRYLDIYTAALSGPRRAQCAPHLSAGQPVPPHPRHQPAHPPPGGQSAVLSNQTMFDRVWKPHHVPSFDCPCGQVSVSSMPRQVRLRAGAGARVRLTLPPVLRETEDYKFPLLINM